MIRQEIYRYQALEDRELDLTGAIGYRVKNVSNNPVDHVLISVNDGAVQYQIGGGETEDFLLPNGLVYDQNITVSPEPGIITYDVFLIVWYKVS